MKKAATFVLLITFALLAVAYVVSLVGFRADCLRAEAGIKAQYEKNADDYDAAWKTFRETSQIDEARASGLKTLYDGSMQSRFGTVESKAMFRYIKEHNPRLESAAYVRLQAITDAARAACVAGKRQLTEKKRGYEALLGSKRAFLVNMWLGYPHVDLDKYVSITSDGPQDAVGPR